MWDRVWIHPGFHFYVVSTTSLLAAAACAVLAFASRSLRSTRLLFLILAFPSIAASAVPPPRALARAIERRGRHAVIAIAIALGAYMLAALVVHESGWLAWVLVSDRRFQLAITAVILALLTFGAWRYLEAYFFTRLPSQAAMALALGLLLDVQVCLTWGRPWQAS